MTSRIYHKVTDLRDSSSLSSRARRRRFEFFLKKLQVMNASSILDVGGVAGTWERSDMKENVTLLNLTFPKNDGDSNDITYVQGNALNMDMFGDKQFDVVFSNSVIEHVGSMENQRRFANEIKRVGKSWWVQTPNKYFPIEPHLLFPYFQFLPVRMKKWVALKWSQSHYKYWNWSDKEILEEIELLRLLTRKELVDLFNESTMYEEKFFGLTKSIVAYKSGW